MFFLSVIPVKRGLPFEELSYFSKHDTSIGDLISIPFRNEKILGVVIGVTPVSEVKQDIKEKSFNIRRIYGIVREDYIPKNIIDAVVHYASYKMRPPGMILSMLLNEEILNTQTPLIDIKSNQSETIHIIEKEEERTNRYRSIVREQIAKNNSTYIVAPTILDSERLYNELKTGIEEYIILFNSEISEKEYINNLSRVIFDLTPLVIISTPSLVHCLNKNIKTVIIEKESSLFYRSIYDSTIDLKNALLEISRNQGLTIYLGGRTLTLEELKTEDSKKDRTNQVWDTDANIEIVDLNDKFTTIKGVLSIFSFKLLNTLAKNNSGHYLLYTQRKGMFPVSICTECGSVVNCETCSRPLVLHQFSGVRSYMCHHCETQTVLHSDQVYTCKKCMSWKIGTLGIGSSGVKEIISGLNLPSFIIDKEHTSTRRKMLSTLNLFNKTSPSILIGTEMALNATHDLDGIIVMSLDGLFSIPEYQNDERIINLINEMLDRVKPNGNLVIQTRLPRSHIFSYIKKNEMRKFQSDELAIRKSAHLPPYYVIVKCTFNILKEIDRIRIENSFMGYEKMWYEAGKGITLFFLHIEKNEYLENIELREKIKYVLAFGKIDIDPLYHFKP